MLIKENESLKNKLSELENENNSLRLLVIKLEGDLHYYQQVENTFVEASRILDGVCKTVGSFIPKEQK